MPSLFNQSFFICWTKSITFSQGSKPGWVADFQVNRINNWCASEELLLRLGWYKVTGICSGDPLKDCRTESHFAWIISGYSWFLTNLKTGLHRGMVAQRFESRTWATATFLGHTSDCHSRSMNNSPDPTLSLSATIVQLQWKNDD